MNSDPNDPILSPNAMLEFYQGNERAGPTCALLTPAIKMKLREIESGQVLEVRVDDPSAKEYILSWSRLSGNEVLSMQVDEAGRMRFFLRKK